MLDLGPSATAVRAALASRALVIRDYIWITAKDRDTGDPVSIGFWTGPVPVAHDVIDAITRSVVTRNFVAGGALAGIEGITLTSELEIREVEVTLSPINASVEDAVRLYDARQAPMQIYRGILDAATHVPVTPALPRFVGVLDDLVIRTPSENGEGALVATLISQTRELTRGNPQLRSDASQRERDADDSFYEYTAEVEDWETPWGQKRGKPSDPDPKPKKKKKKKKRK